MSTKDNVNTQGCTLHQLKIEYCLVEGLQESHIYSCSADHLPHLSLIAWSPPRLACSISQGSDDMNRLKAKCVQAAVEAPATGHPALPKNFTMKL